MTQQNQNKPEESPTRGPIKGQPEEQTPAVKPGGEYNSSKQKNSQTQKSNAEEDAD